MENKIETPMHPLERQIADALEIITLALAENNERSAALEDELIAAKILLGLEV